MNFAFRKRLLFPALAFLLSRGLASYSAWLEGFDPLSTDTWLRWDSGHYLDIAKKGYEFVSCKSISHHSINDWCGNTGWFPGYPLLIRALEIFTGDYALSALIISSVFFFLSLFMIWNHFLKAEVNQDTLTVLAAAALFPGSIYDHAAFPISLLTFLLLLILSLLKEKKPVAAGIAGLFGSLSYSTGFLTLAIPPLQLVVQKWGQGFRNSLRSLLKFRSWITFSIFPAIGLFTVILYQWAATGVWGAFFKVQTKYGYGRRFPLSTLLKPFKGLFITSDVSIFIHLQSVCIALLMITLCLKSGVNQKSRKDFGQTLILAAGLIYWLFPHLLGGSNSYYRSEALLLPTVLLFDQIPRSYRLPIIIGFGIITFFMDRLFFRSMLV